PRTVTSRVPAPHVACANNAATPSRSPLSSSSAYRYTSPAMACWSSSMGQLDMILTRRSRSSHGPDVPARGRGVPHRDPVVAGGEPARWVVRRRLLDDAGGAQEVPRGVDAEALRRRLDLRV